MTAAVDADVETTETYLIPSMLTNSFRVILEEFGESILSIQAHGSVTTTNPADIEELRDYGCQQKTETNHQIEIDYSALHTGSDSDCINPLDSDARDEIDEYISDTLDKEEYEVKPDLSVSMVTVRVDCQPLQEATNAQSSTFDLTFVADPAEDAVRHATRRANSDRGLYTELGFNIENLNLRSVVEARTEVKDQPDWQCLSWQGPHDTKPRANDRLASRINELILPEEFGTLKPYSETDEQYLDILSDDFDDDQFDASDDTEATEEGDE